MPRCFGFGKRFCDLSGVIGRRSVPIRVPKDLFSSFEIKGNGDPGYRNGELLYARCHRGSSDIMSALAQRAILMFKTVQMDVGELDCSAEENEDGDNGEEQKTHPRVLWPKFAGSAHNYSQYISGR